MDYKLAAKALRLLADAIEPDKKTSSAASAPSSEPAKASSSTTMEDEAPSPDDEPLPTLKDLQKAAKDLIKKDRREDLKKILAKHKIDNLSSANEDDYTKLHAELTAA